jgi:hypothetical protein
MQLRKWIKITGENSENKSKLNGTTIAKKIATFND